MQLILEIIILIISLITCIALVTLVKYKNEIWKEIYKRLK